MRLCRFDDNRLGVVEGAPGALVVRDVSAALDALPSYRYPLPRHDVLIANLDAVRARAGALLPGAPAIALDRVRLLSPVANPGKLIAAPVNYEKHLNEVRTDSRLHNNNPGHTLTIQSSGVFLKATSSLVGPGEGVVIRTSERRTDHEVELAFVVGRVANRVRRTEAMDYIAGYTIGLDISIRGSEDRSFRKSPDTYSVLGPWMVTADEVPNPDSLDLEISVNGELRQRANTGLMILEVAALLELASSFYTLYPGDVVFTGTPEGVSPIGPGDEIVATVEGIGTMTVGVRAADPEPMAAVSGAGTEG